LGVRTCMCGEFVTMLHSALAVQRGHRGVERCVESEWTIVGNGLSLVTLLGDSSATSSAVVRLLY
jgi:hypothetical protein